MQNTKGTKLELYGEELISERHRHRYEFNNEYRDIVTKNGMVISGTSPNNALVEAVELPDNTYFIGVQYHPNSKAGQTDHIHCLWGF